MKLDKLHMLLIGIIMILCILFYYVGKGKDIDLIELYDKVKVLEDERNKNNERIAELEVILEEANNRVKERDEKISKLSKELTKVKNDNEYKQREIDDKKKEIDNIKKGLKSKKEVKNLEDLINSLKNNINKQWEN